MLITVSRNVGMDFGITLGLHIIKGKPSIVIENIHAASVAERFVP